MHKEARLPLGNPSEPMGGPPLMALQLLVFPHGPFDQNPIQDPEGRIQRRLVVLPIVVHPSTQDGIEHMREIVESFVTPQVQSPAPDRLPHRFGGPSTDRWGEVDEVLPPAILRPSWAKRIAQKIKAVVQEGTTSIRILTVHDVCLVGMQFQLALCQPGRNAGLKPARLRFTLAMRDDIIGVALEGDGRLFPLHPGIERIMQEEIGKDRADTTPLRDPLSSLDEGAILPLHGGL
jgi:hypothetical protein